MMSNIFDSNEWPDFPPAPFISGDYFAFKRDDLSPSLHLSSYAIHFCDLQLGRGTGATPS